MEERKEVAGPSSKEKEEKKYEKKEEKKDEKKEEKKKKVESTFPYPYNKPVSRSSSTTIEKFSASLQRSATASFNRSPVAVAIGPYYHGSPQLQEMEDVKRAALKEFLIRRSSAREKCEAVHGKVLSLVGSTRRCYAGGEKEFRYMEDGEWAEMLFRDAWFVLQFMVSMFPDRDALPELDLLMSRAEVHTRISDIMRDLLLLENQVPWTVIEALMELWPVVPLDSFLRLMAFPFHIGNEDINNNKWRNPAVTHDEELLDRRTTSSTQGGHHHQLPSHLLGLFYRRQVGTACTQELLVPKLSSLSSTAVELTEMGVKLTASKTKRFGDMTMSKRRCRGLGLSGELSLTPLVLNNLTACWLVNMAAYEECLGATQADNYAVSSYISFLALLMNRKEDTQELRAKGIINSELTDKGTLLYFKDLAAHLHVGHRYYELFRQLQEYKQERWVWIAVHRFLYNNIKTIVAVLSGVGVLAGLFKTILSLKQPQRLHEYIVQ